MQKFYLHDAASGVAGTLPVATQSTVSPNVTATGAATNRTMDGTVGTAQTSVSLTTLGQTATQKNWFRRFISPPLAAQTITAAADTWALHLAGSEANTNSQFTSMVQVLFVWRPGTGALVARLWVNTVAMQVIVNATSETAVSATGPSATQSSFTCQDGDVLGMELWGWNTQGMATAYTNTFFYDGTTEDSATSNAAYLLAPADMPLQAAAAAARPQQAIVSQAVQRAATRCWARRRSGIVVPRLWTPEAA